MPSSPCGNCSGTGSVTVKKNYICQTCDGTGFIIPSETAGKDPEDTNKKPCTNCSGGDLSYNVKEKCKVCHGKGKINY